MDVGLRRILVQEEQRGSGEILVGVESSHSAGFRRRKRSLG